MSKQEILSWTSLATSTSVLVFYLLMVFGWPDGIPDLSGRFFKLFFNVFWVAVVIEIIVEISEGNKKVQKDERDFIIEAKGLKFGYNILVIAVMISLIQVFITNITLNYVPDFASVIEISTIFHFLFIALFFASAVKRGVMIYHYRREF